MADHLSDSERLALVEELLVFLLAGLKPEYPRFGRELHLQQILSSAMERLQSDRKSQLESAFVGRSEFAPVSSHVLELEQRLTTIERRLDRTRETQQEILLALSSSPALASVPFRRIVPAYIYIGISESEIALTLERSLEELAESIGLDVIYEGPVEYSSWFRNILTRTKETLTHDEVQLRLGKVERALELKHLDSVQAKADLDLSKAAKNISDILSKVPDGVVCLGSITGIKTAGGSLVIMTLTQEEMLEVAKNPSLKKSPDKLLDLLTRHRSSSGSARSLTVDPYEPRNERTTKPRAKKLPKSPPPSALDG
jgi:hypothetical protein